MGAEKAPRAFGFDSLFYNVASMAGPALAGLIAAWLDRPAISGLLFTAVAAGSFLGSLLWTWHPIAPHRSPLVTTVAMIGIGAPIAAAAATPSIQAAVVLFGLSGIFIGPFGSALFTARTQYAAEALRTQVFTIGAGLKVTASALGAALIGLVADLSIWALLLIVASSPLLAGVLATLLLILRPATNETTPGRIVAAARPGEHTHALTATSR